MGNSQSSGKSFSLMEAEIETGQKTQMLQIKDTLVSLDLADRYFCCDLDKCLGACCIEGDAGAPITKEEYIKLKEILPIIWDDLLPQAQVEINANGVGYVDEEGDLVTSIANGRNCVFTCYKPGGICQCAIEKAYQKGRIDFQKPISCHLYPLKVIRYSTFTTINYHRWKICQYAETFGRKKGVPLYLFLADSLIRCFGKEWYDELVLACETYLKDSSTIN